MCLVRVTAPLITLIFALLYALLHTKMVGPPYIWVPHVIWVYFCYLGCISILLVVFSLLLADTQLQVSIGSMFV